MQVQKPQPMIPELTSHGITGILDILNNFRGKNQPFGNQASISLVVLGDDSPFSFNFVFSDMKVVYDFPNLLSLFSLNSHVTMIKTKFSNLHFTENAKHDTYFLVVSDTNRAREE